MKARFLGVATLAMLALGGALSTTYGRGNGQCCVPAYIGLPTESCDTCSLAPIVCDGYVQSQLYSGFCFPYRPSANCTLTWTSGTISVYECTTPMQCELGPEEEGEKCTVVLVADQGSAGGVSCSGTLCFGE